MSKRAESLYFHVLTDIVEPLVGNRTTYSDHLHKSAARMLGHRFHGVYPSDEIPRLSVKQPYAILNVDKSYQPGSHWVAVAKTPAGVLVYDSYGRKTSKLIPSLSKSGNGVVMDTEYDAEQTEEETNCGARVLAWLLVHDVWGSGVSRLI